ncbi:MAG: ABC transporter permease [Acidobacteria bacterium]|nr:ABC transporter permease [Acidobacteriota bacterium]MBI3473629.1 ABC transporter permease [Candidatus Solibacter usitatus]
MIQKLVWENIKHRPLRTFLSALLIGVPVTLVLTLVGMGRGMIDESQRRARGVGADIVIRPKGSTILAGVTDAPIPEGMIGFVEKQPHVTLATGIVINSIGGFLSSAAGIDLPKFNRMSGGFRYLQGGPFQQPDDILVDEFYAQEKKIRAGDTVDLMNRKWRVCGVVEAGKLNRVFVDLRRLQDLKGNPGRLSQIYAKVDAPENIGAVIAGLKRQLPDYPIFSMEESASLLTVNSIPELRTFIRVMIVIGVLIGFAVVCLSMYMAVLQRTREIGILKSLGASRWFILSIILREAVLLAIAGTLIGIAFSYGAKALLEAFVPSSFKTAIVPDWWPNALLISVAGAVLGALYPGVRAANQDPIEALAYE